MRLIRSTAFGSLRSSSHQFWKDFYLRFLQASWEVELLIFLCNAAVLVAFRMMQVQAFKVGAKTHKISGEVEEEMKKEEEEEFIEEEWKIEENLEEKRYHAFSLFHDEKEEENGEEKEDEEEDDKDKDLLLLSKKSCFQQKAFPVFVEGVGNTLVVMISPRVQIDDLVDMVQTKLGLPSEVFFLSFMGRVLDSVRMKDLTRESSIRVSFRLRGGMMRVPRFAWTMDMRLLWDQSLLRELLRQLIKQLFFDRLWSCLRTAALRRVFSLKFGKLFLRTVLRRGKRRKFLENRLFWT